MPMICEAPASLAAITAVSPTPPSPITATDAPGFTLALLNTAPAPVTTAQPKRAARFKGTVESILTKDA